MSSALKKALESDAGHFRWVAAVSGSQTAATVELGTGGEPVMAIGGFNNEGGNLSLAQFKVYVEKGEIHYYIASGRGGGPGGGATPGGGGPRGGAGASSSSAISSWVKANFKAVKIGNETVYDLTRRSRDRPAAHHAGGCDECRRGARRSRMSGYRTECG